MQDKTRTDYIVYKHTNKINGKNYIGITKYGENPNKRWQNGRGYKDNEEFFSDIILYGWNNFTHDILEKNLSELDALLLEKKYILLYNSIENGYNKGLYGHLSKDSIKKQLQTKQERYGSERGIHSYTNNNKKVKCKETGEEKTIVFGLTGTGYFDMVAYEKYNNGEMTDYIPTDADLETGFAGLPKVE